MDMRMIGECSTWLSIVGQLFGARMGKLLEPHGLTMGQFSVLHHLVRRRDGGGERVSDIAAAVEMGQPAVTKTLAKFETMGLVRMTPDPKDQRARRIEATEKGAALLEEIRQAMGPDLAQVLGRYPPEELARFTETLVDLGRWLDRNRL
ncbi:MarR family winged helix-turn-helix transcriptional regulator [Rhodovulum sp. DZ06]|uniref:MarR family winged helix-turn-helix transcriptional regulator n=1 Tax=Rhodovulum sp. DZ06 TaxID=3425126 RepID=UPI003D33B54D